MRYSILRDPNPNGTGYTVTGPALPGCVTEGPTGDEALANARDVFACHVEGLLASGDGVPRVAPTLMPLVVAAAVDASSPAPAG